MRRRILTLILGCLTMATGAKAGTTWLGVEFGFPVPAHDLGADQLGVDVGFTIRTRNTVHSWVGVDVLYHYWPASASYKSEVDRYLSQYEGVTIDSDIWAFRIYQATPHLRLQSEVGARASAWLQCGGGLYLLDPNLSNPDWTGGMARLIYRDAGPSGWHVMPGWNAGVGFDLQRASDMAVGLDLTYHHMWGEGEPPFPSIVAFTASAHVMFGW